MLITPTPETSDITGGMRELIAYSGITLNEEGQAAALLLCAEDFNYEVVDWLLNSCWSKNNISDSTEQKRDETDIRSSESEGKSDSEHDKFLTDIQFDELSQMVSAAAREFGGARASRLKGRKHVTQKSVAHMIRKMMKSKSISQLCSVAHVDWEKIGESLEHEVQSSLPLTGDQSSWEDDVLWDAITDVVTRLTVVNCVSERPESERDAIMRFPHKGNDPKSDILYMILCAAVSEGDLNVVGKLLDCGAQPVPKAGDEQKGSALHHCVHSVSSYDAEPVDVAKELLIKSSNKKELVSAVDEKGRTALHVASSWGMPRLCELLLRNEAILNVKDKNGQNPLHSVVMGAQDEDVIDVLIEWERIKGDSAESIVHSKDGENKSPLDIAAAASRTRLFTKLLSFSPKPEDYFDKMDKGEVLRESARRGYSNLVEKLLEKGAKPLEEDSVGKTAFHYAVDRRDGQVAFLMFDKLYFSNTAADLKTACDKNGRNVLHVAAMNGNSRLCKTLLKIKKQLGDAKDSAGQTPLHYAVTNNHKEVVDVLLEGIASNQNESYKDLSGRTPLHLAAENGNQKIVQKLLSAKWEHPENYVRIGDFLGETALHKAARGGHKEIVKKLLDSGARPLLERDCDGRTALHYAVQVSNEEDAAEIAKSLLKKYEKSPEERSLLLWASAAGIGTALESISSNEGSDSPVKKLLLDEKTLEINNLLKMAAILCNIDMTQELLARGGDIDFLRKLQSANNLAKTEKQNVENVLTQIKMLTEQASDQPAQVDNLGREDLAKGIAALFLNPYVKSPVTVGISGEWGMGKSSLMLQTESTLLTSAAQQSVPLKGDNLSKKGRKIKKSVELYLSQTETRKQEAESNVIRKIGRTLKLIFEKWAQRLPGTNTNEQDNDNLLKTFLENYQPDHCAVFKSLAVMDRSKMYETTSGEAQARVAVPAILTVKYNAWKYRNETEAWAGLAVEITKEMEKAMTMAQWLSTCLKAHKRSIWIELIFPWLLASILAGCVTWVVWLLLEEANHKGLAELKYGSLAATLIVTVWAVVKSIMAVLKPISTQIADYITLPDHTGKLGYHQKVIDHINFLKEEMGRKPFWFCKIIAILWCWFCKIIAVLWLEWNQNYVVDTLFPKFPPAFGGQLRIIVFIDDLDRCEENIILQVLLAINLVLAACEINVILGMDKRMVERAIIKKFGEKANNNRSKKANQELAENYFQKIIQLPLDLPDPSDAESERFLKARLGVLNDDFAKEGSAIASASLSQSVGEEEGENSLSRENSGTQDGAAEMEMHGPNIEDDQNEKQQSSGQTSNSVAANGEAIEIDVHENEAASRLDTPQTAKDSLSGKGNSDLETKPNLKTSFSNEMLMPKYSRGERDAFLHLQKLATGSRKLPREWKRLLNYHRLVWNIFSESKDAKTLTGWQVQLIAWIFVCWQWKDRMDTLIQSWHKLDFLHNWLKENRMIRATAAGNVADGPSLREIVDHYMEEKLKTQKWSKCAKGNTALKEARAKEGDEEEITGTHKNDLKEVEVEGGSREIQESKIKVRKEEEEKNKGKNKEGNRKVLSQKEEEELEDWQNLKHSLNRYNVSMAGIQAFQKFRFYCVPGYLSWPLVAKNQLSE
eukprot:Gb_22056 [translate_table: standard]